jgi:hypothetical protein
LANYKLNQTPRLDDSTPIITYGLRIGRKRVDGMKASGVGDEKYLYMDRDWIEFSPQ